MNRPPWSLAALATGVVLLLLFLATPGAFRAQSTEAKAPAVPAQARGDEGRTVLDVLNRPFAMPFARPTALEDVARQLEAVLGIPVVLDRAALTRLELVPTDSVQLELKGVRLKTSLQLLLDQVGMTYRAVPEDNLLILTDDRGSEEPLRLILDEIDTIHAELHDVRDELHTLKQNLPGMSDSPTLRKPTIIEELPGAPGLDRPGAEPAEGGPAAPAADPRPSRKSRKSA